MPIYNNLNFILNYGRFLVQSVTSVDCKIESVDTYQSWHDILDLEMGNNPKPLRSALNILQGQDARRPKVAINPPIEITLTSNLDGWVLNPKSLSDIDDSRIHLGKQFIKKGGLDETNLERFYGLMQKYTSTLPCTYGEPGVSLFRQWAMMAALMTHSPDGTPENVPEKLGLIGIDLPGIQDMVYTIASRGAGKTVRGRSAFVQLLVNAVVDRLLYELKLCRANVIVNAGGNALLLCAWSDDLISLLGRIEYEINQLLFKGDDPKRFNGFAGDLPLALTAIQMPRSALAYSHFSEWQFYESQLKEKLNAVKKQPFASLLQDEAGLVDFFEPDPTFSAIRCAVCQKPQPDGGSFKDLYDDNDQAFEPEAGRICPTCHSFLGLANALARSNREGSGVFLNRQRISSKPAKREVWQEALYAITSDGKTGYWYKIADEPGSELSLALSPDDFPAHEGCHGYWPMATTTPLVTDEDIQNALARQHKNYREKDIDYRKGDVRDNELLASDSPSTFKRLGVLKADVDSLGALLYDGLNNRSAAQTATLSESLMLFFGGWLDKICQEDIFRNKVYILYAGGDDLLIIGTWHIIPLLAKRIADDFRRYTGHNPSVHLSAGISIVGGKEPLYAAIDSADKALENAKAYTEGGRQVKNAISFMEKVHSWKAFDEIVKWYKHLYKLRKGGVPSSLFMNLLSIYEQYLDDHPDQQDRQGRYQTQSKPGTYHHTDGNEYNIHMGPWMWQMFYRLTRLKRNVPPAEIEALIKELLSPNGIERIALSARWAQLLSREKK